VYWCPGGGAANLEDGQVVGWKEMAVTASGCLDFFLGPTG
jgi:hypothetical protein